MKNNTTFYSRANRGVLGLGDNEKKEKVSFCMSGNPWDSLNPEKDTRNYSRNYSNFRKTPRKCCVKRQS